MVIMFFRRDRSVVTFCGRLAIVTTIDGRFLALAGVGHAESDRVGSGGNRKDIAFLLSADGEWLIGGKPKRQMLVSEKKRRRLLRASL
jgi:hypothetical protein